MSLRRLFSSGSKSSSSRTPPVVVAATTEQETVHADSPVAPATTEQEAVHVDNLDAYDPKEDHPLHAYYKGYNSAKKHILERTCFQGVATESEIKGFVANLLPTIHMADTSDDKKKELTEKGVRMALKHFGFLPPEY